jgi:hypothetical protein
MDERAQFRLHAYVCGDACVQYVDNMGTLSFMKIFMHRPSNCRYAIVTRWNIEKHADEVIVWDMFETLEHIRTADVLPPPPRHVCDSIDAAIMATTLLYEDE